MVLLTFPVITRLAYRGLSWPTLPEWASLGFLTWGLWITKHNKQCQASVIQWAQTCQTSHSLICYWLVAKASHLPRLSIRRRAIKPVSRRAYTNLRTFNATRQTIRMIIPFRQVVPPPFLHFTGKTLSGSLHFCFCAWPLCYKILCHSKELRKIEMLL